MKEKIKKILIMSEEQKQISRIFDFGC
jgi:hypothetical protein